MDKIRSLKLFTAGFVGFTAIILILSIIITSSVSSSADSNNDTPPLYIVKSDENGVGVFTDDDETAKYYLDISPALLPDFDRNLLRAGIKIYSEEELNRLIADLDG